MVALGKVKMQFWNCQYPAWRKHPCSSSAFSFDIKRKLISPQSLLLSPPPRALSVSSKIDEEQADSAILPAAILESDPVLVRVKFVLEKECRFGERFCLVGDDPLFGLWDPSNGITLDWSDDHVWSAQLDVPMGKKFEYKFVLLNLSGDAHWQPGPNRLLLLDQVIRNTNSETSIITVWEDWDSASKQIISLEGEVPAAESGAVQNEIEVPGSDCNGATTDESDKSGENSESIQGDVDFGIITRTGLDSTNSDSKGIAERMILAPGLNSERVVTQEDAEIGPVETGDGDQGSINEMPVNDCEDESYNEGEQALKSISFGEVISKPTTADILRNDLQRGQKALKDSFPTTAGILGHDLQWGQKALKDFISRLGLNFNQT